MLNKERQAETEVDSEQMLIDIPSAQMPQNPMLPAVNRNYRPTYNQWKRIEDYTEFCPNESFPFSRIELVDFKKCKVHLKGGKKVSFDCLSEKQYVWVCNGGYYEDAQFINEDARV